MCNIAVAPLVGAWIEIYTSVESTVILTSLLSWERGLKYISNIGYKTMEMSLLSWERGLKSPAYRNPVPLYLSLLSWERGLKFMHTREGAERISSLLSWERGLKSGLFLISLLLNKVAPLVGAWIEII